MDEMYEHLIWSLREGVARGLRGDARRGPGLEPWLYQPPVTLSKVFKVSALQFHYL